MDHLPGHGIIDLMRVLPRTLRRAAPRCAVVLALALAGCAPGRMGGAFPTCEGSTAPGRWMLQPGGVLQGVVASTSGKPIVGAVVRIQPLGADSVSGAREAVTATQGAFALDSMTPGRYAARASAPGHGAWAETVELADARGTIPRIQLCSGR